MDVPNFYPGTELPLTFPRHRRLWSRMWSVKAEIFLHWLYKE